MENTLKTFTAYWPNGKREVLQGNNPIDAFRKANYGKNSPQAPDFWAYGDNNDYAWNAKKRQWARRDDIPCKIC